MSAEASSELAWGSSAPISRVSVSIDENHVFILITVTPDAKFLIGAVMPRRFGSESGKLVLLDVHSHNLTEIHRLSSPEAQVVGAASDGGWVIWSEASHQPDFSDWVLFAYNTTARSVKKIASAPLDSNGMPLPSPFILPKVDHGIAVWAEGSSNQGDTSKATVKTFDLAADRITTLTDSGLSPVISWPYVGWVEPQPERSQQLEGAAKGSIVILNLATGERKTLRGPDTPLYFGLYKESLVWITSRGEDVVLTDINEDSSKIIAHAANGDSFQFPLINNRLVTWISFLKAQVWDRTQDRLVTLDATSGTNELVNGSAFVWSSPLSAEAMKKDKEAGLAPNDGVIYVLNTTQLPTTAPR